MSTIKQAHQFGIGTIEKSRIARHCVCCGGGVDASPAILMPFISHRALGWKPVVIDESWGLNSIRTGNAYAVCNSLMCSSCGHLFLDIRFSDAELADLYRDYRGEEYTALRDFYEPGYRLRNEALEQGSNYAHLVEAFLSPYLQLPVSILDWGGDTGKNTPYKHAASRFDIYDISEMPLVDGARRVAKEEAFDNQYELIVCSNVLEHVPYPSEVLFDMAKAMSEKSVLYIEVPFEEVMRLRGSEALTCKKHWHEHINFYSLLSMQKLLENCGFEVLKITADVCISAGLKDSFIIQAACRLR